MLLIPMNRMSRRNARVFGGVQFRPTVLAKAEMIERNLTALSPFPVMQKIVRRHEPTADGARMHHAKTAEGGMDDACPSTETNRS